MATASVERTVWRRILTILCKNFEEKSRDDFDIDELTTAYTQVETEAQRVFDLDEKVQRQLLEAETSEDVLKEEFTRVQEYRGKLYLVQAKYDRLTKQQNEDARIVTTSTPKINRDNLRQIIKDWWTNPEFNTIKQLATTLSIAKFESDIEEAHQLITEFTNLQVNDNALKPDQKLPEIIAIQQTYKSILLDKEVIDLAESEEEELNNNENMAEQQIKITPRYFSGQNENVEDYFTHFSRVATSLRWTEQSKINMLPIFLLGDAQEYYTMKAAEGNPPTSFADWQIALTARFSDPMQKERLQTELYSKKQNKEESARDYVHKIEQLAYRVDSDMSVAEKCRIIQMGLNPDMTRMIATANKENVEELKTAIARAELALQYAKLGEAEQEKRGTDERLSALQRQINQLTLQPEPGGLRCLEQFTMMKWLLLVAVVAYASADSSEHGVSPGAKGTSCKCGWANRDSGSRIVGGKFYKTNEYPFIVGIASVAARGYSPFCGGSIITPNHVITAAHCTDDVIKARTKTAVLLGTHDRSKPSSSAVIINVASIQQHAGYNAKTITNDISILTLASSINFNKIIGPVCLPQSGLDVSGQTVRVLGWGAEKFQGSMTLRPKKLDTTAVTINNCATAWGGMISTKNPTQLCTLSKKETACQGDSGGPVVWLDPQTNRYTLVGLVSFGASCTDERPTVNTRVAAYLPWIQQQIAATKRSATCTKV
ncbi:hypothetical protein GE061_010065 [Apolygus lucorum]|uniref:Peptidase S1 domain-containing protein n=1 Tax=Apolygus lucorum TaxID=248454 RepID=A0A8S9Y294_APOLU|nr:hypothetical protein GE061_010065 [Apolygus lucorum]